MATDYLNAAQWALHAIQEGWSAKAGLERFRAEGGHIADATWYKLTGELQNMLATREGELNRPLNLRPTAEDIKDWRVSRGRGFMHQVEVLSYYPGTREIVSIPFSLQSRTLRSRQAVINEALEIYSNRDPKKYPLQALGAVYTGTYRMVPEAG